MKTAEWYEVQRRLRECERQLKRIPEPAPDMRIEVRPGVASARLQQAGMLMDAAGQVTFTLKLPMVEPPLLGHEPDELMLEAARRKPDA